MEFSKNKLWFYLLLAFGLGSGIAYFASNKSVTVEDKNVPTDVSKSSEPKTANRESSNSYVQESSSSPIVSDGKAPAHALETLEYVLEHNKAPEGYIGGRTFQNREGILPRGSSLRYQEWDVHPKSHGENRGGERLLTCSDGSAYYTGDHYRSFVKLK
jgi:ribonuclease T1